MWPFTEKHAPMLEPELVDAMKKRLDELNERSDRFERVVKDLRLEWDEMYDKMRLLYARASKRIKDAAAAAEQPADDAPESHQDAPEPTIRSQVGGYHPHALNLPRRNY